MKEADSRRHGASDPAPRGAPSIRQRGSPKGRGWDLWTFPSLESVVQDVKYAFRSLVRDPGFTSSRCSSWPGHRARTRRYTACPFGLRSGTAVPSSERLVVLIGNVERTTGVERRGGSYPDFVDWRAQAKSFEDMAVFDSTTRTLVEGNEPERVPLEAVSSQSFPILGVKAAVGRSLQSLDEGPEAAPVVMRSEGVGSAVRSDPR